jgi:hypothetical protein
MSRRPSAQSVERRACDHEVGHEELRALGGHHLAAGLRQCLAAGRITDLRVDLDVVAVHVPVEQALAAWLSTARRMGAGPDLGPAIQIAQISQDLAVRTQSRTPHRCGDRNDVLRCPHDPGPHSPSSTEAGPHGSGFQ